MTDVFAIYRARYTMETVTAPVFSPVVLGTLYKGVLAKVYWCNVNEVAKLLCIAFGLPDMVDGTEDQIIVDDLCPPGLQADDSVVVLSPLALCLDTSER